MKAKRVVLPVTLRDYFAGQALASFAGNEAAGQYFKRDKKALATNCYALADAMLLARAVPGTDAKKSKDR